MRATSITRLLASVACVGLLGLGCASMPVGAPRPAWELPPPPVRVAPVVQEGALTRSRLENGIEALVLTDRRLPQVTLGLTLRSGAAGVDPSHAGLAQFTAELMNRGAGGRDALALAEAVDALGARLSVSADWDSMSVVLSGLSRDTEAMLALLRDVALAPRLEAAEADKTRREQLAALEAAKDQPATTVHDGAMRVLYEGHRFGLPLEGVPETVQGLDAEDARALHARYFVPGNAILHATGDIDAQAVLARFREVFASWAPGPVPDDPPAPPPTSPSRRRIVIFDKPDLVQARIVIAHEGLARTDERRIAASLLNATLGGSGFSSRMMKELRSNAGLTYSVGSGFSLRRVPGPFLVSSFTRVPEVRRAVGILLDEIEGIRGDDPQSEDELRKAKSYNVGQFGLGLETSAAVMASLVNLEVYGLPRDSLDTYRARVNAVTVAQTHQIARELLHPERAAIVLLGPAEDLRPQLQDLGEVETMQP